MTSCPCCKGACCTSTGCTMELEADCAGEWLGPGVACDPNPCHCSCANCDLTVLINGVAIPLTTLTSCADVSCGTYASVDYPFTEVCSNTPSIPSPDPCAEWGDTSSASCTLSARACITACDEGGFTIRVFFEEFFGFLCNLIGTSVGGGGRLWYVDYNVTALPPCGFTMSLTPGEEVVYTDSECPDYFGVRCCTAYTASLTCNPFP